MFSTVREFVLQMYRLITASNPTVPLHGDDEKLAIRVMNQILSNYASNGLLLTIAKTVSVPVNLGITDVWFVPKDYPLYSFQTETVTLTNGSPDFTVGDGSKYQVGDLVTGNGIPALTSILSIATNTSTLTANATLSGASLLTFAHYIGLPIITFPDTNILKTQLYPAPSQFFEFNARGKFQLQALTSNDSLDDLPEYFELFFLYAVAKYVSKFKGRGSAWTDDLEMEYRELKAQMEAASEINLSIAGDEQSLLNGSWRVRAGI